MDEHPTVAWAVTAPAPLAATRLRHSAAHELTSLIAKVKTLAAGRASWADGLAVQRTLLDELSDRKSD